MQRIFVLWMLFGAIRVTGQPIYLYPVRQNHLWGFMDGKGQVKISPQFEAFSEVNLPWSILNENPPPSPFRLVELKDRVGLINDALKLVLPCAYKRILPIHQQYFAVEKDSLFEVIHVSGETAFPGVFEQVCGLSKDFSAPPRHFLVKSAGKWGVVDLQGRAVIPMEYWSLQATVSPNYFRVKKNASDEGWGLIDLNNRLLLPFEYSDIQVYRPDFMVVRKPNTRWYALGADFQPLMSGVWKSVIYLNRHFAALESDDESIYPALYDIPKKSIKRMGIGATQYLPLDDSYFLYVRDGQFGLIDSSGAEAISARYDSISFSGEEGLYRVKKLNAWGLFNAQKGRMLVDPKFQLLDYFNNGWAQVVRANSLGLINKRGNEVLPAMFMQIDLEPDTVRALTSDGRWAKFVRNNKDSLEVVEAMAAQIRTISIGKRPPRPYREAEIIQEDNANAALSRFYAPEYPNVIFNADSSFLFRRNYISKWWEMVRRKGAADYIDKSIDYVDVARVQMRAVAAVYTKDAPLRSSFTEAVAQYGFRLCKMALFDLNTQRFITDYEFLGIRVSDFDQRHPYAAYINLEGKMGLMDARGNKVMGKDGKPLIFSYIGPFYAGFAPVCIGGELKRSEGIEKTGVGFRTQFLHSYFLREPVEAQYSEAEYVRSLYIDTLGADIPHWGYIDERGNMVMPDTLDYAGAFRYDSTATILRNGLYGMIDKNLMPILPTQYKSIVQMGGQYKIGVYNTKIFYFKKSGIQICPPVYTKYAGFAEDRYAVRAQGKWGFIDSSGQLLIPCRYDTVRGFSEGLAAVISSGIWTFIDKNGVEVFSSGISATRSAGRFVAPGLGDFSNGRCRVRIDKRWGYYNKSGQLAIAPVYQGASDFVQGRAVVKLENGYGLIDTAGVWVLSPGLYAEISPFNAAGLAAVKNAKDGLWGLVDGRGVLVSALKYEEIGPVQGGFIQVKAGKKYGLLNREGKELISPQYHEMHAYSEGFIAVRPNASQSWVFVDTLGHRLGKHVFQAPAVFAGGYARVGEQLVLDRFGQMQRGVLGKPLWFSEGVFGMKSGKMQYFADANGNNLFGRNFTEVQPFEQGIGKFRKNGRLGALNRHGVCVIQPKFNFIFGQADGNLIVRPQQLYGLADKRGKILIPPEYDRLERMQGGLVRLELGEQVGYLRLKGNWVWKLE